MPSWIMKPSKGVMRPPNGQIMGDDGLLFSESQDKARKIAGALHWIDLERQVLQTILKAESSKGAGLLHGKYEVILEAQKSVHAPSLQREDGPIWTPLQTGVRRIQPCRYVRPRCDCKLLGSEDYCHQQRPQEEKAK
ncbi:unnamed protein product [Clonostachys rhizophaga]|uniref:Uncharacterized protein n=1 Tax=Clonostachys rhizophaga TaxID=160324 RepID=A0A9N9VD31_9HYPO|nr:unnamed protein product [Clonostachys rhizophaga]